MGDPYREAKPAEDAIRSIRVARVLMERFRAIVASRTTADNLALKIGESQQIYPKIWRHLDDGRRALITQGRDVSRYDEYRSADLVELGVDVELTRELDFSALLLGGHIRYTATKTATFNMGGIARAEAAAQGLMSAMPEIDWEALARSEDREIAAAGSMTTSRWVNGAKIAVAVAAVAFVAIGIQRLATGYKPDAPAAPVAQLDFYGSARHTFNSLREQRITDLRHMYELTCDPKRIPELAGLLRADGQTATAHAIETNACARAVPTCEHVHDTIMDRAILRYSFIRDRALDFACRGVIIGPGELRPALAVLIAGRVKGGKTGAYRAVVDLEGKDIVAFEASPVPAFVGSGDLDGDVRDELVMVGDRSLVVTRIEGDHFVDIAGPTLQAGCQGNANVERDLREAGEPDHDSLVISVDDPHPRKGCPETGRHYYTLAGQTITASD